MAQPDPYAKTTDFAEYQTAHQSAPFNGALLDAELVDIQTNLQGLNTNIGLIQRDDGDLANSVVTVESLSTEVLTLIASEAFNIEGAWATATLYAVGDIVAKDGVAYICLVAHTSGTFSTDLTAEKWVGMSAIASQTDANFQILGSGDASKIARFEVDGFTTATTRTFTLPNASCTLAALEVAQTWTANQAFSGNVTIGDAAGDTLTVNAGTWTLGSNFVATRASGTVAAGAVTSANWPSSFTGDSGGTTDYRAHTFSITTAGANAIAAAYTTLTQLNHATGVTLAAGRVISGSLAVSSTGSITSSSGFASTLTLASSGNITTHQHYLASAPTLSSTGAITTLHGFSSGDLGHATLVTNAIGFNAADMTGALTLTAGFRGQLSAGTGKYNLYLDGTAQNYIAGRVGVGVAPLSTTYFYVQDVSATDTSVSEYAAVSRIDALNTSGNVTKAGMFGYAVAGTGYAGTGIVAGVQGVGQLTANITINALNGSVGGVTNSGAGTITIARAFLAVDATNSGGGVITDQVGYACGNLSAASGLNMGFRGFVASGTGKYNLYMDGTAHNYLAGALGVGTATLTGYGIRNTLGATGATSVFGYTAEQTFQSDVTVLGKGFATGLGTQAAAFTLTDMMHFSSVQATIGAASAVTNQYGFHASSTLTGATNNYGFYSNIAAGSNRWNFNAAGTAQNYFAGVTGIGIAASSTAALALAAGTTGVASLRIPHGAAPTSPVDGDIWTTSAGGLYVRINGVTVGPLS